MEKPIPNNYYLGRKTPVCHYQGCYYKRETDYICVFNDKPTFSIRGLCKESVMDIQYKFADHKPLDQGENLSPPQWGKDNTRGYVGPKGWTISRDPQDQLWKIKHSSYDELSLTMLDRDALPVGKHKWRVENNVCNQGETNDETLMISGCQENQFTCDDGKCLNITQRCNNVEVSSVLNVNFAMTLCFSGVRRC